MKYSKKLFIKHFSILVVGSGLLVLFGQNCSKFPVMHIDSLSSTSGLTSTEFAATKSILATSCISCHDGNNGSTRLNYQTEDEFISANLIVAGQPDQSRLIQRLRNYAGTTQLLKNMPPAGQLTSAEYSTLRRWIMAASAPTENTSFTCNEYETIEQRLPATTVKALNNKQYLNSLRDFLSIVRASPYDESIYNAGLNAALLPTETDARFPRTASALGKDRLNALFQISDVIANRLTNADSEVWATVNSITQWNRGATCTQVTYPNISIACRTQIVRNLGLALYRRPLIETQTVNEVTSFMEEWTGVVEATAVNNLIMRMLMSQNFLFHMENQEIETPGNPKLLQLSSYTIANRLSYAFWNTMPDDSLRLLAKNGNLSDDIKFLEALEYVLASSKVESSLREFAHGWLDLKKTPHFDPANPGIRLFSEGIVFDETMRTAMNDEAEELVSYLTRSGGKFADLFTTDISFTRYAPLMRVYGVASAAPTTITAANAVRMPAGTRSGVLTRAALLADNSGGQDLIHRAMRVKRELMCLPQPPPPANTIPPVPLTEAQIRSYTTRQQLAHNTGNGACFSCHQTINQFGFPTTKYNGLGFYKSTEPAFTSQGQPTGVQLPIDSTSDLSGVLNGVGVVSDALEYSQVVGNRSETQACFTRHYANYFLDREPDVVKDGCRLNKFNTILQRQGTLKDALRSLATDTEFRLRKLPD